MTENLPEGLGRDHTRGDYITFLKRLLPVEAPAMPYVGLEHIESNTMRLLQRDRTLTRCGSRNPTAYVLPNFLFSQAATDCKTSFWPRAWSFVAHTQDGAQLDLECLRPDSAMRLP